MTRTPDYITRKDLREELVSFKDEILSGIDKVMGELETIREENTLGVYQTRELTKQVDNHEKRIKKLETS